MVSLIDVIQFSMRCVMFKTVALLGTGVAIAYYYRSHKTNAQKIKGKNLAQTKESDHKESSAEALH